MESLAIGPLLRELRTLVDIAFDHGRCYPETDFGQLWAPCPAIERRRAAHREQLRKSTRTLLERVLQGSRTAEGLDRDVDRVLSSYVLKGPGIDLGPED